MIRVLLVDDQPLVRAGLRRILEPQPEIEIAGECEDGDQVLDAVREFTPDLVVMDIRMKRMSGVEAILRLRERSDAPPVLALTTFDDEETVASALNAGAAGFVLKDARGEDIVKAVLDVAAGGAWLDPRIAGQVLDAYRRVHRGSGADRSALAMLTERELDGLRLVGQGATNAEIAAALFIGEATVKTHLGNILGKLNLRDRPAAIVFAITHGVI